MNAEDPTALGAGPDVAVDVLAIERPHPNLLIYYGLASLVLGPLFFFALIPLYFRYQTLHYRFDEEGVSMRWGILFRREIHLTYARIQDIHLTSNLVERWLGLAKVQIQTASGSSKAEMVIEGRQDFTAIRDFLYARMRGMGEHPGGRAETRPDTAAPAPADTDLAGLLRAVALELREVRRELAASRDGSAAEIGGPTGSPEADG